MIKGTKEVKVNMLLLKGVVIPGATKKGLEAFANRVLRDSKTQVPLDRGDLQRSTKTEDIKGGIRAGYDIKYAARQHEELRWNHKNGRKAKYLEDPLKQNTRKMPKDVGIFIKRKLK